jgi:hypothetical protein
LRIWFPALDRLSGKAWHRLFFSDLIPHFWWEEVEPMVNIAGDAA